MTWWAAWQDCGWFEGLEGASAYGWQFMCSEEFLPFHYVCTMNGDPELKDTHTFSPRLTCAKILSPDGIRLFLASSSSDSITMIPKFPTPRPKG